MIPNMGGIDPRRISSMMKQMGITNTEIPAKKVIIETDTKKIIINNPNVTEINMQGQKTFQILGDISEEELENKIPNEDVDLVLENTKVSKEKAKELLEKTNGDIAKAISLASEEN
jgi:nascent polypeptide-associated complex subunit alpha